MRSLLKVTLIIAACFATTFIVARLGGWLSVDQIRSAFAYTVSLSTTYVIVLVILLLFADLFIAVPTLTVTILAGSLLGFPFGAAAAITGMGLAAVCGYVLSYRHGDWIIRKVMRDPQSIAEATHSFRRHGITMIVLARAVPILPEVTACLAGLSRMPLANFGAAWSVGTVPYVLIAAYAGSISSIENPKPAIFVAIGLTASLWLLWLVYYRLRDRHLQNNT